MLRFDPKPEPTTPRDAATVVVLRDGERGLETFCVLRSARSSFLGGAVVFPGGKVDPGDASPAWDALAGEPPARSEVFAGLAAARTLAVAACRETLEEARIVPLDRPLEPGDDEGLRKELAAGGSFSDALTKRERRLDLAALTPWARWVTPEAEARRYDARFFLLELPAGQSGRHDDHETTMSFWSTPAALLDRFLRGEVLLAPPTLRTLELLATTPSVGGARALAAEQPLLPICPCFIPADPPYLALPGDPSHQEPERRVAGPTRFVLHDGRFLSEEAPEAHVA